MSLCTLHLHACQVSYRRRLRSSLLYSCYVFRALIDNFSEIKGEDNLTVFSYPGRVKSPEWRRQRRRADLRQCQIFRHGPIIIYTRLPAGGTYYPICMFHTNGECLIGISDAFFCLLFTGIRHLAHVLTVTPTKACLLCATLAGIQVHASRHLPSTVPWISEARLLTPLCVDSARSLWASFCFRVLSSLRFLQTLS